MSSFRSQSARRAPRKLPPHVRMRLSLEALEDRTVLAPVVTAVAPVNTGVGVGASAKVSATFSVAMNKATITSTTFQIKGPGGLVIGGAITYNNANFTATFDSNTELNYA